jgi:ATP-dependent DNA ligase
VNDPFPLTQCKTMNIVDFAKLDTNRYLMEPKIDGWRIQMEVTPEGVQAWTRTNHSATGKLPKAEQALVAIAKSFGKSFRLDGEVVYLDENGNPDFNFTSRCMGSGLEVCVDKQREQERYLSYVVFDVLQYNEEDMRSMPFEERRQRLERIVYRDSHYALPIPVNIPDLNIHYRNIDQFGEGSVLKDITAPYAGKRHKSWLKWKAEETVEVRCIGYKEGQGKFAGLIGAIVFKAADGTIGNCSGMDDEMRVWISDNKEVLLNKTLEVKHYGRLVDGYRHPQFVRWRADK